MNKINKYFLMGSVAFTGMMGFTACSSDNDAADNGNGTPTENTVVKTQFALNVPQTSNTRMGADMTQQGTEGTDWNFRGINNMRLLTFTGEPGTVATSTTNISLGSDKDAFESDNHRRIYRDIMIPIGTDHFVFYGTATGTEAASFKTGSLGISADYSKIPQSTGNDGEKAASTATNLNNIEFSLVPAQGQSDMLTNLAYIPTALNKLTEMSYGEGEQKKTWKELGAGVTAGTVTDPRLKHAGVLYNKFVKLTAGSKTSVLATLVELKKAIGVSDTDYPNPSEFLQQLMNDANTAYTTINGGDDVTSKLGLPDGVATLKCEDGVFSYVHPTDALGGVVNQLDYSKVCYPASLNYWINTTLKATDDVLTSFEGWPSYTDWKNDKWDNATSHQWESTVSSATRSIGLEKAIQYAVATLKTQVRIGNGVTTLSDNAKANGEITNRTVPIRNEAENKQSFTLKGIVVGGQPSKVGWNYVAKSGEDFKTAIYDNEMNKGLENDNMTLEIRNDQLTRPNYTLVLDNKRADNNEADVVYVTLELVNNSGMEFFGHDGIVPQGGKFYLVGKLDTTDATNNGGVNSVDKKGQDHIFVQDHTTIARFTIGSLKNAYNTIPDLRSSSISLGLAVNLEWQNGMVFDYTID